MGDIVNIVINPNKCAKCGAETTNLVVCNSCNLPPGETKYYHFSDNRGECFFRVRGSDQDVLQIVTKTSPGVKKGSYKKGVYYIRYNSFIGNKGWKLSEKLKENGYIKEISKTTFDSVLDQVTNGFKDPVQTEQKPSHQNEEIRRYAQSIVGLTVKEINIKADSVPDNVAVMKEQELLDAVISELKEVRGKQM